MHRVAEPDFFAQTLSLIPIAQALFQVVDEVKRRFKIVLAYFFVDRPDVLDERLFVSRQRAIGVTQARRRS